MEISSKLTGDEWSDLPLYAEGTLASLSPRQVLAKVKKIIATCGLGYDKPLANYDPSTQSLKMSEGIFPSGERPLLLILPPSGMTRNGALFQQPPWEPIIGETESLLWPTPTAHPDNSNVNGKFKNPTLGDAVRMWPTPRAAMHETRNHTIYERSMDKPQNLENRIASRDPSAIGGKLNPRWVEWLMGFPDGWTDLEA